MACPRHFFFFQAEGGIRDLTVTGVQTCALPISHGQLIFQQIGPRQDVYLQTVNIDAHLILPSLVEFDAVNAGQEINPARFDAELEYRVGGFEIFFGEVEGRRAELRQRAHYLSRVLGTVPDPDVDVARRAREAVRGEGVSADDDELNPLAS